MGLVTLEDENAEHQLAVTESACHSSATQKSSCRKIIRSTRMDFLRAESHTTRI